MSWKPRGDATSTAWVLRGGAPTPYPAWRGRWSGGRLVIRGGSQTNTELLQPEVITREDIEAALGACDEVEPVGAAGGFGQCWRVRRGTDVQACKVILRADGAARFDREVEALSRMGSDRVLSITAWGHLTVASDGTRHPYLLSEFVVGGDVRANIGAGLPSSAAQRSFLVGMLRALEELQGAAVVHRDLKPENIILREGDWSRPVIIDLGLSRLVDLASVTAYPWQGGTWPYMAPEQLLGERAIHQTDVWALSVIAGELARGSHPFWRGEPAPPSDWEQRLRGGVTLPPDAPAGLVEWVREVGSYAAYRRPTASRALIRLEELWP